MKPIVTLLALLSTLLAAAQAPHGAPQIPVCPALETEGSFTMIMVPDPQSYTKFAANQPLFELQTAWIVQNIGRLNIRAALFTGDMVEQNNKLIAAGIPTATTATRRRADSGSRFHGASRGWTGGFPT